MFALADVAAPHALGGWFNHAWWWFEIHTGTQNEAGPFYGFFSGFGSDIGELAIVGALIGAVRAANCHIGGAWPRGCWRLGSHVYDEDGVKHKVCRVHHPALGKGHKLDHAHLVEHHAAQQPKPKKKANAPAAS